MNLTFGFILVLVVVVVLTSPSHRLNCHALDPANLFWPPDVVWTANMSTVACGQRQKPLVLSHYLPLGCSYEFECPLLCLKAGQTTVPIWIFAFGGRVKLVNLNGSTIAHHIDGYSGRLKVRELRNDGTFYCQANGRLFARHSVTVFSVPLKVYFDHEKVRKFKKKASSYIFEFKQVILRNRVSGRRCFSKGQNQTASFMLFKTVIFCHVWIKQTKNKLLLERLADIPNLLSCFDHRLKAALNDSEKRELVDNRVKSYVLYEYLHTQKSCKKELNQTKTYIEAEVTEIVATRLGARLYLTCSPSGHSGTLYRWDRVFSNTSMPISPRHIERNSKKRIAIDFLDNLIIKSVTVEDLDYRYQCFNLTTEGKEILITSKKLQLALIPDTSESVLALKNIATYIMISLMVFVGFTVFNSVDVSEKK